MKTNPNISVSIVSYNFEKYIGECIESILNQTLKPSEIIITDDCSTDNSWGIIEHYVDKYPGLIKAIRQPQNMGPYDNGTLGFKIAGGDLLSAIDGDDKWRPRKLELEWKALQNNPLAKIAYSNVRIIDNKGNQKDLWVKPGDPTPPSGDVFIQVFSKQFFKGRRNVFRNELIYRDVYNEFVHDKNVPIHLDWDFKIRITAKYHVAYSGETLVEYRSHSGGISAARKNRLYESARYVVEKNKRLFQSRTLAEKKYVQDNVNNLLQHLASISNTKYKPFSVDLRPQGILLNSLPKAGTNLAVKVLGLLPELKETGLHLGHSTTKNLKGSAKIQTVPIGIDFPNKVNIEIIKNALAKIKQNHFASAHIPYSKEMADLFKKSGIQMFLMLRDPRDVVVSHARYIAGTKNHPLHNYYQTLSFEDQIMASIKGVKEGDLIMPDIGVRTNSIKRWIKEPNVCILRFENLVGEKGGGDKQRQHDEIRSIAEYSGLSLSDRQINTIAEQSFGGTATFRKGSSGSWKTDFTDQHKKEFNTIAGSLLIEQRYEPDSSWVGRKKEIQPKKNSTGYTTMDKKYLGENLIFLISQPRAGSTLLQRMLGSNEKIHTVAEPWVMLHPVYALRKQGIATEYGANYALQALDDFINSLPDSSEDYCDAIREMGRVLYGRSLSGAGKQKFLDKTPRYYHIIKELYYLFPKAKFVFLLRNPLSVLSSILHSFVGNNWDVLSLHRADLLKAPNLLIEGIRRLGTDAIVANYESIVADPEKELRALCNSLNIKYNSDMLNYGNFAAPQGRMGDQIGIKQHTGPVNDKIDKWISKLDFPEGKLLAETYLSFLGREALADLGYDFSDIQQKVTAINSDWKNLPHDRKSLILDRFGVNANSVLDNAQFLDTPKETLHSGYTVSAIVSTYNSEDFIYNCLEDLTAQTLYEKGGLEIIVVNSGSGQNEDAVIKEYIKTHGNIKYIKTEQRETIYQAWNCAIKIATGKYLTNANTDDRHRRDAFEILAKNLDENPKAALVYADQIITEIPNQTFEKHTLVDFFFWPDYDRNYLLKVCSTGSQPMWRRSLHRELGYFDESLYIAGDYEFWLRITQKYPIKHIPELLGLYFRSGANAEFRDHNRTIQETAFVQSWYRNKQRLNEQPIQGRPLVSVIIPTYNRPLQLETALRSVALQTYKNIEVIVVNDAGEDVHAVVDRMKKELNVILINHNTNKDRAEARNTGLKKANGKYIAYLDDDDVFHVDHIETALRILTNTDYKITYSDAYRTHQKKVDHGYRIVRRDIAYSIDYQQGIFLRTNITPTLCIVHEKSVTDDVGGFDAALPVLEDWDLWIRMSQKYNFYHIKKVTCEFTWRDDGSTTTSSKLDQFAKYRQKITDKYLSKGTETYLNDSRPLVSIIMLTFNALEYTKKCIKSILQNTRRQFEIIIVDNNSTDGTKKYLRELQNTHNHISVVFNKKNKGFAAGNNQAVKRAKGEYVMILNNDVLVGQGWLSGLAQALEADEKIGMVGPLTNSISGLQMVAKVPYKDDEGFYKYAADFRRNYGGNVTPRRRIAGFAVLMKKSLYREVGGFDESYGTGNFEDDDLCLKVRRKGYALMVDEGTFIHHYGSQSFKANKIDYNASLEEKGKHFKQKWPDVDYEELLEIKNPLHRLHEKQMGEASQLFSVGNPKQAQEIYLSILKDNPISNEALLGFALCAQSAGDNTSAIVNLNKVIKLCPENHIAYNQLGIISVESGDLEGSKTFFAAAIEKDPAFIDAQRNYGNVLIELEDYENGVKVFHEILQNHPDDIPSLLYMAQLYVEAAKYEEGLKYIKRVMLLDDKNETALQLMNIIKSEAAASGLPSESEADNNIDTAHVAEAPPECYSLIEDGSSKLKEGDTAGAKKCYLDFLRANPNDVASLYGMGIAHRMEQNNEEAFQFFKRIIQIEPNFTSAYNNLGSIALINGNLEEALKYFARAVELEPHQAEAKQNLSDVLIELGHYEEGVKIIMSALKDNPEDIMTLIRVGKLHFEAGKGNESKTYFEKAVKLDPGNETAMEYLNSINAGSLSN